MCINGRLHSWDAWRKRIFFTFEDVTVGHFSEGKNDVDVDFNAFYLHFRNVLYYFHLSAPDLDSLKCRKHSLFP